MAKILIVEDDMLVSKMVKMHLSLVGHSVFEAEDAPSAREILNRETIDLTLLDVMLPGEDGFSIREKLILSGMSVLFLTARTEVSDRVRGLTMGAAVKMAEGQYDIRLPEIRRDETGILTKAFSHSISLPPGGRWHGEAMTEGACGRIGFDFH